MYQVCTGPAFFCHDGDVAVAIHQDLAAGYVYGCGGENIQSMKIN
jgi:hypothetical protein